MSRTRMNTTHPRRIALATGLAASSVMVAGSAAAAAEPLSAGFPDATSTCRDIVLDGQPFIECTVQHSGTTTLDALDTDVTPEPDAPVVITAYGTNGNTHYANYANGRTGGAGGAARTVLTAGDIDDLYIYLDDGHPGWGPNSRPRGGAAGVVTSAPIQNIAHDAGATPADEVYLIAGGGGGLGYGWLFDGGRPSFFCGAGAGGRGGIADASTSSGDAVGSGANGRLGAWRTWCSDENPREPVAVESRGGGNGIGGKLGNYPEAGYHGQDGIGGQADGSLWVDSQNQPVLPTFGGPNAGGGYGGASNYNAGGGGGYGGGSVGLNSYGGGGGGSFATQTTAEVDGLPTLRGGEQPHVTIAFPA